MTQTRRQLLSATLPALLILLSTAASAAGIEDRVRRTFDAAPGGTLTIDTQVGSIEVTPTSTSGVVVEVIRTARTTDPKKARELFSEMSLDFSQQGNDVRITSRRRKDDWPFFNWNSGLRVRFQVSVPYRYNVDLSTSGGDIRVSDLGGQTSCRTSGGDIVLGKMAGSVKATTSGGDVSITGGAGAVVLKTSGGDIKIGDAGQNLEATSSGGDISIGRVNGEVTAKTSGGDISIAEVLGGIDAQSSGGDLTASIARQPSRDSRLSTSGGTVTVTLGSGIGVELDARTSGGSVDSQIPVTVSGRLERSSVKGKVNAGGPLLHLRTSGGDIRLRKM